MTLDTLKHFEQPFTVDESTPDFLYTPTPSTAEANNYLMETFHQYPHGDFRPTFYNPFEIKHRHRTSRDQLKILEKSFSENSKPSATVRRILAQKLEMTPRGVQIWFQNRRAKAKLLRRRSCIQNQSSDENELNEEKEKETQVFNPKSSKQFEDHERHSQSSSSTTADINQSSVLFSQFFTSQQYHPFDRFEGSESFAPPPASNQQRVRSDNWPVWQQKNAISPNVRTVATAAAAAAVANSTPSPLYKSSLLNTYNGPTNWLNMSTNFPQNSVDSTGHNPLNARRQSCPVPMKMTNMNYLHDQPQLSYLSPSWSPDEAVGNISKYSPLSNNFKRHLSYDPIHHRSVTNCYTSQDISIGQQQQLTPPLTSSCSASTVAGSPVSLGSLYNDPITLSHTGSYEHTLQHISSPFSTNVADIMPSFT